MNNCNLFEETHYIKEIKDDDRYRIIDWEVNQDTVGQYTGLKDKNGVEIYEGDIVAIQFDLTSERSKVIWLKDISGFIVDNISILDKDLAERIVVIGNIYDNPELLEKEV